MNSSLNTNVELDNKLIELIRANPTLYEKELRATPYESMKKKTEMWKSIATSLGLETRYCIIRWKNLKEKFRRELAKQPGPQGNSGDKKNSSWPLFDKMRFLKNHMNCHNFHQKKSNSTPQLHINLNEMDAEQLVEEVPEDDPLQEAMDEQNILTQEIVGQTSQGTSTVVNIKRIEALLEGLDDINRTRAEKRIVAYLCKCHLKSLNNEDVNDILI